MFHSPNGQARDEMLLAPYAMNSLASRGRAHPEPPGDPYRPVFQRDRERVVHCRSFRRLTSKTQVLAAQTNDHHRTRLTHSLEVAQISRTCARMLGLNEDLVEAVALSHDLGHPPFGHAGERALDECARKVGGFDHNLHALRIVDELEHPYPAFAGLNLSWEVRSAFAYHAKRRDGPLAQALTAWSEPLLEFQVVDLCDGLAYNTHDLDDALGAGIITLADLDSLEVWHSGIERAQKRWPGLTPEQSRPAVVRGLLEWLVYDLVEETRRRLSDHGVASLDDIRTRPRLVGFSAAVDDSVAQLQLYLRQRVYRHPWVMTMADEGQALIRDLFDHFVRQPDDMPAHHASRQAEYPAARVVCDYLAGMTDRFVLKEHQRLCGREPAV